VSKGARHCTCCHQCSHVAAVTPIPPPQAPFSPPLTIADVKIQGNPITFVYYIPLVDASIFVIKTET
jgi:hypothetical protein